MTITVFLSYANYKKNQWQVTKIKNSAKLANIDVFCAKIDMVPGDVWRKILITEIPKRKFFVALGTADYNQSVFANHEFGMAIGYSKDPITLKFPDCGLDGFMDNYQVIDATEDIWEASTKLIQTILKKCEKNINDSNYYTNSLIHSSKWRETNFFIPKIMALDNISAKQFDELTNAFIRNREIYGTNSSESYDFANFLLEHSNMINSKIMENVKTNINTKKYFAKYLAS